ncbi:hypothetical protein PR001_g1592 [Phytophthora rubi]|uniref:Ubiquitin-like protease family profile domain-containing protein n=1 Tax=Phytophthora rubi TaxID=129364 RepID=A0A6A3P6V1_9STRA|nr:hypothetical protein PR001_g1592 [Phytophthora rubi]
MNRACLCRWTNSQGELNRVRQFSYARFQDRSVGGPAKRTRTEAQRYTEAVLAFHVLASELADIDEDDEYESILEFVLQQWRNVRQHTMVPQTDPPPATSTTREDGSSSDAKEDDGMEGEDQGSLELEAAASGSSKAPYKNACSEIATHLKDCGLQDYEVAAQNNPIQFDAFSCGVYVCWMFISYAEHGLRVDLAATSLPRRRFELF